MTRNIIAVDLDSCIGCHSCAVVCKQENNVGLGTYYNKVLTVGPSGTYPDLEMYYLPVSCQHCDNPECVSVCPTGASYKREDGIVWVDSELCIGCESCIKACPYEGVRTLIKNPEYYLEVMVGEYDAPPHKGGTVEKCTFCKNLIDRGEVPACMQLCPGRARYWGDLDDPESDVSKAIEGRETVFLQEEAGTKPNVYYLQ